MSLPPYPGNLVPLSDVNITLGGKTFCYDATWIISNPLLGGDRVVRVARQPPDDMPNRPAGHVYVQFMIGSKYVWAMPEDLLELTPERKAKLSQSEMSNLMLYDEANEGTEGFDQDMGMRVMRTKPVAVPTAVYKRNDDVWIKDLKSRPELNGKHVIVDKWIEAKGRWQCHPYGWSFDMPYIGLKPINMTKGEGATMEECLANAQADSERIRRERRGGHSFQELLNQTRNDGDITDLLRNTSQDAFREFAASHGLCS